MIPFSVADMEFMTAPEIVEGLKRFLDTNVLGYAQPTDAYKNAVKSWMKKRHGWDIDTQWIKDTWGHQCFLYGSKGIYEKKEKG